MGGQDAHTTVKFSIFETGILPVFENGENSKE